MLGSLRMKAPNRIIRITAALLLAGSAAACKSDAEKRDENVEEAREKVIEKTENVQQQQQDMAEAKADLAKARAEFLANVDARLNDLDARIAAAKTNAVIDQGRLTTLRTEATSMRAQIADETRPFAEDMKASFERILNDIDTELNRK
jgi:exonuclease VII large subunit